MTNVSDFTPNVSDLFPDMQLSKCLKSKVKSGFFSIYIYLFQFYIYIIYRLEKYFFSTTRIIIKKYFYSIRYLLSQKHCYTETYDFFCHNYTELNRFLHFEMFQVNLKHLSETGIDTCLMKKKT